MRFVLLAVALLAVLGVAGCAKPSGAPGGNAPHATPRPTGAPASTTTSNAAALPTGVPTSAPPAGSGSGGTSPGLHDGPGPQSSYAVQAQPSPGSCHYSFVGSDPLPDPRCTPGALNPAVTEATMSSTICKSGYTSSIRPPESITEPEKRASAAAYGYTGAFSTAEYDHLVPLELGGDPNDPANLWVEPNDNPSATTTANSKDVLEDRLNSLVCAGQLGLTQAQDAIASNWVTAYHQYVGTQPSSAPPSSAPPPPGASSPSPSGGATCAASAAPANDGYSGDYYVTVTSNQPNQKATASDARDSWSDETDSSGSVRILLYDASPGEQIAVTVGAASCSTSA